MPSSPSNEVRIRALDGIPEVRTGDKLSDLILLALAREDSGFAGGERARKQSPPARALGTVLVVAQKVVSKSEGRFVSLADVRPSEEAERWAARFGKDARMVEVVLREARRVVRMDRGVLIVETKHGFVCANAGVDASNAPAGTVVLLPENPDASAEGLRRELSAGLGEPVAVIISDTFGRPWRQGLTNVALGVAGLSPFIDYRGQIDSYGKPLQATVLAVADELAAAAELVMGKVSGIPVAVIDGFRYETAPGSGQALIRPPEEDLFR